MRVIAGTYRSRILKSLKGLALRPTSEDGVFSVHFCAHRIGTLDLRNAVPQACGFVDNASALPTTPQAQQQQQVDKPS